ncbi:MAG: glutamine--fructose-6-phosphate transaminase (isomerizing) [Patescibacteria group bacterium]|jgi:glucosamine--fructose-6-phosphate aminotransferase (isomerizing)
MCGIVGYTGSQSAKPILISGLKRLEYRGYDSAGIAVLKDGKIEVIKQVGSVSALDSAALAFDQPDIITGIAHTRWATHGEPNDVNAHPHCGCGETILACKLKVVLVHNGTIENFESLRQAVIERGHVITSETDSEILAHLIAEAYDGDPLRTLRTALGQVQGTYGLAVLFEGIDDQIFFARNGAPLVLGISDQGNFIASDAIAFREFTDRMVNIQDGCVGWVSKDHHHVVDMNDVPLASVIESVPFSLEAADRGRHDHFMKKEIGEQPLTLANALQGRLLPNGKVKLGGLDLNADILRTIESHGFVGAGTSLNAGMIAKILFQEIAEVHADWENASELANQRWPKFRDNTAFWAISQSGETQDLIEAIKTILRQEVQCFGIVNKVGSVIARMVGKGVYIHAGLEIGVASTKAFTNQVITLTLIALYLRQIRGLERASWVDRIIFDLHKLPELVGQILAREEQIIAAAEKYAGYPNFLYLGRGLNYPVALEGALKLKEIAYVNAIGYSTGEMKHGPIALIDGGFPTMVIAPKQDNFYARIVTNINQIRSRHGRIIAVATDGDEGICNCVNDVIWIPPVDYFLSPILAVVPLQLFAYHIARIRGLDPDQPRNLAKSVTVH